jgi:hypothetical protein
MKRVRPLSANHKRVYRVLPSASGPMTAYQLLRPNGISAAPTVYRARLETMYAYVPGPTRTTAMTRPCL